MKILGREFYHRDTIDVAKDLLGKVIVRVVRGKVLSGMIVETEAYRSKDDPGSHAYRGMTERNRVMFGEVGRSYVYFTYGNHYCLNLVAKDDSTAAGATLIRAIEPLQGIELMRKFRKTNDIYNLVSGPGKLTKALDITKHQNAVDVTKKGELYVTEGRRIDESQVIAASRIGIKLGLDKKWRFLIKDNSFVSKKVRL